MLDTLDQSEDSSPLLLMSDDVLHQIGIQLLISNPPAAASLRCTCRLLHAQQRRVAQIAEERCRLRWLPSCTSVHAISADGHTLTQGAFSSAMEQARAWSAGQMLPAAGTSSWDIDVEQSLQDKALLCVGVCDAACTSGWGLNLNSGRLTRRTRHPESHEIDRTLRPRDGLPDGQHTRVGLGMTPGQYANLRNRSAGAKIRIFVAHSVERGGLSLSFEVNGGLRRFADVAFPHGTRLRPWAMLGLQGAVDAMASNVDHDAIRLSGWVRCPADAERLG